MVQILAYKDVKTVLDNALGHLPAEVRYTLPSPTKAVAFRHRANRFRKEMRRQEEITHGLPEGSGSCIYDSMIFRLDGNDVLISQAQVDGVMSVDGDIVNIEEMEE